MEVKQQCDDVICQQDDSVILRCVDAQVLGELVCGTDDDDVNNMHRERWNTKLRGLGGRSP